VNGRILRLGGDEHDIVQLLLPWHDSGQLDAADAARVAAHLGSCARCQADVAWLRRLRGEVAKAGAAGRVDPGAADVDLGWAALRQRMGADASAVPAALSSSRALRRAALGGWRWLLAAQSAVIAGLAALLVIVVLPRDATYRGLGSVTRASDASIVVVFRPDANEAQIRQALRDSDARLVDGPTVTGAYLLAVAPAQHTSAIDRLRRETAVLRVESLTAGAGP
jgi:anti-sigma factor RsiW